MRGISIRLALGAIIATGCLLLFGYIETTESLRFRSARELTFEQFKKEMPKEGWFHIKNAQLNVTDAAFEEDKTTHTLKKAFVPIISDDDLLSDKDVKTLLLVETTDPAILDTVRDTRGITDDKAALKYLTDNKERVFPKRDVEGMLKTGLNEDTTTREELAKLDNSLAPNYVLLQEGKHPSLGLGIAMILGGLLLAVGQVLFYLRRWAMR